MISIMFLSTSTLNISLTQLDINPIYSQIKIELLKISQSTLFKVTFQIYLKGFKVVTNTVRATKEDNNLLVLPKRILFLKH